MAHELIPDRKTRAELPFEMVLKKVTIGKSGWRVSDDLSGIKYPWLDYQPNNLAWPIMSERMKNIIVDCLTGEERIVWMTVNINGGGDKRGYFIPRFEKEPDVLDEEKTIYAAGTTHVVRPVFSHGKINKYGLFTYPALFGRLHRGST